MEPERPILSLSKGVARSGARTKQLATALQTIIEFRIRTTPYIKKIDCFGNTVVEEATSTNVVELLETRFIVLNELNNNELKEALNQLEDSDTYLKEIPEVFGIQSRMPVVGSDGRVHCRPGIIDNIYSCYEAPNNEAVLDKLPQLSSFVPDSVRKRSAMSDADMRKLELQVILTLCVQSLVNFSRCAIVAVSPPSFDWLCAAVGVTKLPVGLSPSQQCAYIESRFSLSAGFKSETVDAFEKGIVPDDVMTFLRLFTRRYGIPLYISGRPIFSDVPSLCFPVLPHPPGKLMRSLPHMVYKLLRDIGQFPSPSDITESGDRPSIADALDVISRHVNGPSSSLSTVVRSTSPWPLCNADTGPDRFAGRWARPALPVKTAERSRKRKKAAVKETQPRSDESDSS